MQFSKQNAKNRRNCYAQIEEDIKKIEIQSGWDEKNVEKKMKKC